jgi:predicted dehydrogenase
MGISVCLVGLGQFGSQFVALYRAHPLVARLALCDMDEAKLAAAARQHGVSECYHTLDEVCHSDVQAVVLITQPWLHAAQALQVLRAGKHVYSAVPPVYGTDGEQLLAQCDELVRTVRETGQLYMLGETTFFRSEVVYCRQRAAEGAFGYFTYGECEYWHDLDNPNSNLRQVDRLRWGSQWGDDKRGAIPMHYPTHATASMVSIMNTHAISVSALGYERPDEDWFLRDAYWHNVYGNEVALYRMANGAIVRHSELRRVGHPGAESFRLFGTEGSFLWDEGGSHWSTRQGVSPVDVSAAREPLPPALAANLGGHGGSHAYLVNEFVAACAEERQPRINVWQAMRYMAPGIVAHQSALRDGETLPVPDWGEAPA